MKVLLISYFFYPQNAIGAFRPTSLAKYLSLMGHEISIICASSPSISTDNRKIGIISSINTVSYSWYIKYINKLIENRSSSRASSTTNKNNYKSVTNCNAVADNNIKQRFKRYLAWKLELLRNKNWANNAFKVYKKNLKNKEFDVVFSSSLPCSVHMVADKICRNSKLWIADFRDVLTNSISIFCDMQRTFYHKFQNDIIKKADIVTVVSNGQRESMIDELINIDLSNKIFVLSNGFDGEIVKSSGKTHANNISFCYTGDLYSGVRDISMLFSALHDLHLENKINVDYVSFNYAGKETALVNTVASFFNLGKIVTSFGYVPREKSIDIQNNSDILIVLSWNTKRDKGIMTAKLYEYMQANKPIIALVSGDLPNSELVETINKLSLGLGYEYSNHDIDFQNLKSFIELQYNQVLSGQALLFNPDYVGINAYHYENITKRFLELVNSFRFRGQL